MKQQVPLSAGVATLYRDIRAVLEQARASAYRAVNFAMVQDYWQVGRLIVEHEQKGKSRAGYGEAVVASLADRLTRELGRGFDERNLWYMRSFYLAFPILNAPRSELPSPTKQPAPGLCAELSWTHYRLLLRVESPQARQWYMREAVEQNWSSRQLDRQISVLYYERLLASRKKAPVRKEAADKAAKGGPEEFIRDPYVLDFLDLKDVPALRESKVEQAIIDNLQSFLLELGKGFSFVARQKRMRFEDESGACWRRARPAIAARNRALDREDMDGSILAGDPIATRGSGERWQHWAIRADQGHRS